MAYQPIADTELPAAIALANNIAQQTAPIIGAQLYGTGNSNEHLSLVVAQVLSDGSSGGRTLPSTPFLWNSASWDKQRNTSETTLLTSAARTTTQTSADIPTYNLSGITVTLDLTAIVASPSLVVTIDGKDSPSGKYYNLLTSAPIIAVSTNVYRVALGITVAPNLNVSLPLPRFVRTVVTPADADSATYSMGYVLHSR
jgi:hypothetical protein